MTIKERHRFQRVRTCLEYLLESVRIMASQYSLVYKIGELEGKLSGKSKDPLVKT